MLYEPTVLAATGTAIAAALENYGCDAREIFARAGLDFDDMHRPGARYPWSAAIRLWRVASEASGDPCIGLYTARRFKPQSLHALGLSWLASHTLDDGINRLVRYSKIANTILRIDRFEEDGLVGVASVIDGGGEERPPENADANLAVILVMCRYITHSHFNPAKATFRHAANEHIDQYIEFFGAPVFFSQPRDALFFEPPSLANPAEAGDAELAREIDRIADRYLATIEPDSVQRRVRDILLTLLPSGEADQHTVARNLNRSVSTLQRQLKAEGASYRQVLDETREQMAVRLVAEGEYSLGQIAYLLGFSDQANFSRAFKRWTGAAPTEYRKSYRISGTASANSRLTKTSNLFSS